MNKTSSSGGSAWRGTVLGLLACLAAGGAGAAVPGVYDADGRFLGRLMDIDGTGEPAVVSTNGYWTRLDAYGGVATNRGLSRFFLSANCTGPEYFSTAPRGMVVRRQRPDTREFVYLMFRLDAPLQTVRAGTTISSLLPLQDGAEYCQSGALMQAVVADPGEPNDPAVTGIQSTGSATGYPLSIRMLHGDWTRGQLFESGFSSEVPSYRGD